MTGDTGRREPIDRPTDLWRLPAVRFVEATFVRYQEPIRRYVSAHEVVEHPEAVEFRITTDEELPIRALPAVLFVGDQIVNDYEQLDREHYVFRAFDPARLMPGASISLGWPDRPDKTKVTDYRYEPPPRDEVGRPSE